jgi:hypothetical protein
MREDEMGLMDTKMAELFLDIGADARMDQER